MSAYVTDIERDTLANDHYRRVVFTGRNLQLVLMTLQPGEEIGREIHDEHDQFLRVEAGTGELQVEAERFALGDGVAAVIPAGLAHNVVNTSRSAPLRLYTLYAPPEHRPGTVHATKADEATKG